MNSARDIIAETFRRVHQNVCYPIASQDECELVGLAIIEDLRAAGYTIAPPGSRILRDGELDAVTVERCAEVADVISDEYDARATGARITSESIDSLRAAESAANRIAAALRALIEPKEGANG